MGMRLRFQGDPAHLMVKPLIIPDHSQGITRHYLVLLDAVPGGTGFLKALFQDNKDGATLPGEGVMNVLQFAKDALETCQCRKLQQTKDDTDGCYRCIRSYHMQHRAENISRERGITLLTSLIAAGAKRQEKKALDEIKVQSLFGSVLEKRFIRKLQDWVTGHSDKCTWRSAIIAGSEGFEFTLGDDRWWSIELQPQLGSHQNVSVQCQPDFMLRCDDPSVKPIAVFTDGFEPHVKPGETASRLSDDMRKLRAILESDRYLVWSIAWNDLDSDPTKSNLSYLQPHVAEKILKPFAAKISAQGLSVPPVHQVCGNPFEQLKAFLKCPVSYNWKTLTNQVSGMALIMLASQGIGQDSSDMNNAFLLWRCGYTAPPLTKANSGEWVWLSKLALNEDMLVYGIGGELVTSDFTNLRIALRLGDSFDERKAESSYLVRWRQFLALMNLFQFSGSFLPFTTSEVESDTAPELSVHIENAVTDEWKEIIEDSIPSLEKIAKMLASANKAVPEMEFYDDSLGDDLCAELAWSIGAQRIAILAGDQASFTSKWQDAGWIIITDKDIQTKGEQWLLAQIPDQEV